MTEILETFGPSPEELALECWAIASNLSDDDGYLSAMDELLRFLPDHLVSEVFANPRPHWAIFLRPSCVRRIPKRLVVQLWDVGTAPENWRDRFDVRLRLAPYLPETKFRDILEKLVGQDDLERSVALEDLAGCLPPDLIGDAVCMAASLQRRSPVLRKLASRLRDLPPMAADRCRRELLAAARLVEDRIERADTLASLLPELGDRDRRAVLTEITNVVSELEDEEPQPYEVAGTRYVLLKGMLPYLYGNEYQTTYLRTIVEANNYDKVPIEDIPPITAGRSTPRFLVAVLETLGGTCDSNPSFLARGLKLFPGMSESLWRHAVDLLAKIEYDARATAEALAYLAVHAPARTEELEHLIIRGILASSQCSIKPRTATPISPWARGRYLELYLDTSSEHSDGEALLTSNLAVAMNYSRHERFAFLDSALTFATEVVRGVERAESRACLLRMIVPFLDGEQQRAALVNECLAAARAIESDYERAHQLALIIPLAEPAREDIVAEAHETAKAVSDSGFRCECLLAVAKYTDQAQRPVLVQEALCAARSAERGQEQVKALLSVLRYLLQEGSL
jgi:hypothetical protein